MANFDAIITDLIAGDFRPVPWTITNVPTGGAVTKGWLTVKEVGQESGGDPGIFQKVITTTLDVTKGHITSDGAGTGVSTGFFYIRETESMLMVPLQPYSYDMQFQITMSDLSTRITTPEKGTISTIQGVTTSII